MSRIAFPSLSALVACAASLSSQAPPSPVAPIAPGPFLGVFLGDADADGQTWVRGERYKLGLSAQGATFQPLFGPKASRDFPLTFGLAGCSIAGKDVALAATRSWRRTDDRFTSEHGGVQECWTVRPEGAQQWFVLAQPTTPGAVTLRIDVAGDLAADGDGPGVRFAAPGLGEVRYSDAVAIDAAGRRLELPVDVVDGDLVIQVPTAFVAGAQWPVVVDPLLTTFAFDTTVGDFQDAKVACEPTTGNWLVVAEEHLSATDVDVVMWRYSNAVPPVLLDTVYAENSTALTRNPGVGFVAQTQNFIVAWHNATANNFQLRSRQAGSTTMGTLLGTSAGIGADPDNRCAIGSTLAGDRFLLVLFRKNSTGTDIFANLRSSAGTSFGTMFVGPLFAPSQGTMVPGDVSTAASLTDKWVVVWRECSNATCGSQLVRMQAIVSNGGGSPLTGEATVTLETASVADHVSIAGHGGNLLATWRAFDAATLSNDIHGVPIGISGGLYAPQGPVQNLSAQEPNVNNTRDQFAPSVGYDGTRFVYGYLEDDGTDLLFPHAATVFVSGPAITWHEGHLPLSTVPGFSHQSFDLAASTRQLAEGHHLAVFQQHSPTFTGDVRGAYIDARKPGVLFAVNQTGCGAPSEPSIGLTGTPALGRTFTIGLGNVTGFPFLLVGPENFSLLPGCGGCSAGIDLSQMQAFGSASLSVDVPPAPSLLQFRLAFQGLTMLQTGGCPASFVGFDFALSDTLTVQIL
ncbi:MAG: hypothetical protein JNK15_00060 [Planctomycetes bacterium]|nr:hypothetical protein [Planctomycetota bacterium]